MEFNKMLIPWMRNLHVVLTILLVMLCSLGLCQNGRAPIIKEHPKSFTARRNEPVTLNCAAAEKSDIRWYKNGEIVVTGDDDVHSHKILLPDGSLFFLRVTANRRENDAGTYWCVATNEFGSTKSNNATLVIASIGDQFLKEPRPAIRASQGASLKLACRPPTGVPTPTVTWRHKGETVLNNSRIHTSLEGDLYFHDVAANDAGTYVCIAQNMAGTRESSPTTVTVMSSPMFEERPMNLSTVAGATVEFHCKARGSPLPNVTWRRLDGKMPLGRVQIMDGKTLKIVDVTVSDSGIYECEARSEAGSAKTLGSLKVVAAPEIKEKPSDVLTLVGKELNLKCKLEGDPTPLLIWRLPYYDRNAILTGGQNNNRVSVSQDSSVLKVTDLDVDDSGAYYCWGISSGGGISTKAEVTVVAALPPPLIGVRPHDQHVAPGSSVNFPCEVVSEAAEPTVTWWFQRAAHLPSHQLTSKSSISLLPTGALIIRQVSEDDSGIYTCRVSSKAGSIEAEAILKIEAGARKINERFSAVLAPPSKPRIIAYNNTSVRLTWLPNSRVSSGNGESYTVEYWRSPWQEWRVAKTDIKDTSSAINDLSPNTAYVFLVRAVNENGESFPSPWSDVIYTITPPDAGLTLEEEKQTRRKLSRPSVALTSARSTSPDSVTLTWELLAGNEIEIDGVIIYSVGKNTIETATVLGVASSSQVVRDLRPNTPYTFFLVPFWRTIEGVPSNSQKLVTPEEAPEVAPTGLRVEVFGSGATLIKWEPLTKNEARGNIIGYRVSLTHNSTTTIEETLKPWLEAQGLVEGRLYTVRVAGVSGGGVGPWSSPELIDVSAIPPAGHQDSAGEREDVPSVLYAPPHPVWLLYLLVPILIFLIVVTLLYLRKVRRKAAPSTLEAPMGPALYSAAGVYAPAHHVNMYGEQKLWRPTDSDQDSSLSSARLLRPEHLANEYAEPRIQRLTDTTEPYATTALLAPSSPRMGRTPPGWRHARCTDDIQVNWAAFIPPPPTCPPPPNFPSHIIEGDTCSSATTSESGERRLYHTGSSSQYENAGGSEQYERPCDIAPCDVTSDNMYAAYAPVSQDGSQVDNFQTFNTLQHKPMRRVKVDLHPVRIEPPKSNTH